MRRAPVVIVALALAVSSQAAPAKKAEEPGGIAWEKKLDAALAKGKAAGKPVLVDFWAEWCTWCHELDRTTYVDPKVVALAQSFVPVKVNTEGSRAEVQATARYGIESLPTIEVLSPEGHLIHRMDGFQKPAAFVAQLEDALHTAAGVLTLEKTLAAQPSDAAALAALGLHLYEHDALEDSRELLTKAMSADADRPVAERKHTRLVLGTMRDKEQKYADAEKLLKSAIALTPADAAQDAAAWAALGKAYSRWGKNDLARPALQKAIELQPDGDAGTAAKETLANLPGAR
jgi:thioredoxin-like negative regulator of GroEL